MKVTKRDLLREIWASKLTYCEIVDPRFTDPDQVVSSLDEVTEPDLTIRVETSAHLSGRPCFDPFVLYRSERSPDGSLTFRPTVWSHQREGHLTPGLARLLMAMAQSYARKGSWRGYSYVDEMVQEALLNLVPNVLKYHEAKSDNPHAYITRCMQTSFIRELNKQKKQADIRDRMLISIGRNPSHGAEDRLK